MTQLTDHLHRLLSIEIDEPFVDLEHLCPRSAWLVLHLDLVRPVTNVRLALDAFAVLCVRSECVRLDEKLHEAYWRQMLTSDVMRDAPSANAPVVSKFIRFVRHNNLRVMLSWQGKRFQSSVATQLRGFLEASVAKYEAIADAVDGSVGGRKWLVWRPLRVGIRFADASFKRQYIKSIKMMLSVSSLDNGGTGDPTAYLCEQHTLCKLDLQRNRMGTGELQELADLLEAPQCRRIDELNLEKTFPDDIPNSLDAKYINAFKRVMTAALNSKTTPRKTTAVYVRADAGVGISLAGNTMCSGHHLQAVYDALETATRRLSALSLARTTYDNRPHGHCRTTSNSVKWLARICMTSPATAFTKDALLDITQAELDLQTDEFHDELTEVVLPRLREALLKNGVVHCRVRRGKADVYATPNLGSASRWLRANALHRVLEVLPSGWCRVSRIGEVTDLDGEDSDSDSSEDSDDDDDDSESEDEEGEAAAEDETTDEKDSDGWIPLTSLAGLYAEGADGADIMRMRFPSLVYNGENAQFRPSDGYKHQLILPFVGSVGHEIQRISLRDWFDKDWSLSSVLSRCPNLRELDAEGSWFTGAELRTSHWTTLEAVNVSRSVDGNGFCGELSTRVDDESRGRLKAKLRYLSMLSIRLCAKEMGYLRDVFQRNRTLEVIELDACNLPSGSSDRSTSADVALSTAALSISRDHDNENLHTSPLAVDRRVAVACLLRKIPHFQDADVGVAVLSRWFDYAGHVTTRRIVWCDQVHVHTWFKRHRRRRCC